MKLTNSATAGTNNREDVKVTVGPCDKGIIITVNSTLKYLFSNHIKSAAMEVLNKYGIDSCSVHIEDKSALDYVVRARVETAVKRSLKGECL